MEQGRSADHPTWKRPDCRADASQKRFRYWLTDGESVSNNSQHRRSKRLRQEGRGHEPDCGFLGFCHLAAMVPVTDRSGYPSALQASLRRAGHFLHFLSRERLKYPGGVHSRHLPESRREIEPRALESEKRQKGWLRQQLPKHNEANGPFFRLSVPQWLVC